MAFWQGDDNVARPSKRKAGYRNLSRVTTPEQCLFLIFTLLMLTASISHSTEIANVPLDHPAYAFIDRMVVRGVIPIFFTRSLPLTRGEINALLGQISGKVDKAEVELTAPEKARLKDLLALFADKHGSHLLRAEGADYSFWSDLDFSEELSMVNGKLEASASSLRTTLMGSITEFFAFAIDVPSHFIVGESKYYPYHTETTYEYTGNIDGTATINTYMKFKLPWFELQLGKNSLWWGPGRYGALLISDNSPSWDMLKLSTAYDKFTFAHFTGMLRSPLGDRYISGHRLEALITPRFRIGIHEVVVYGNRFELHYLNPATVYFFVTPALEASSDNINDNMLTGLDFELMPLKSLKLYGELVIDDYQQTWNLRDVHNWANLFGVLLGMYYTNPLGLNDTDLHVEYTFINQFCYTHGIPINSYQNYGYIIGHWLGPDSDYFRCDISRYFTDKISIGISYGLERHGEGSMDKPWPISGMSEWQFLSGVTERRDTVGLRLSYGSIGRYLLSVSYEYASTGNVENDLGEDSSSHTVQLMCSISPKK